MIVNAINMLNKAKNEKKAVPQFNINNLEWTRYILESCDEANSPVILGASEGAIKYMGGYKTVFNLVKSLVEDLNITVEVAIHLDHGSSVDSCKKAIEAGFTSVMFDGSKLPLFENIEKIKEVINFAKQFNVSVEGEIGQIGGEEDNHKATILYADKEDCDVFVKETNVDFLAAGLGSVHGLYKEEPNLQYDLMKKIATSTNIPIVLHGGTGIPDNQIKKAIENGISKININTELQVVWSKAIREFIKQNEEVYDPRKIINSGKNAVKSAVREKIELFGTNKL